ncbi:hypothetical protein RB597_008871 [Gaeumannomyces tritici]
MAEAVTPFKVQIPDSELELLRKKLELARLPDYEGCEWGEEAEGGVTSGLMRETVDHWRTKYDWRAAEARMNEMSQYKTSIQIDGFDAVNVHFVHAKPADPAAAAGPPPTPLLFLHGWPGSFIEVQEMLPRLLAAGFHVVAPSLAGFGFSGYPRQAGFQLTHQAEMMNRLMARLGYGSYLVQGGDVGSLLGRIMAVRYPKHVKALHLNMIFSSGPNGQKWPPADEELTPREQRCVDRAKFFQTKNSAYQALQATKPRTVGYAFHDSPLGMLAWMADKVLIWSDPKAKAWTPDELITWTLLHYFPGPTTGMVTYRENDFAWVLELLSSEEPGCKVPLGLSQFPEEVVFSPRRVLEADYKNLAWMREHDAGGHFAASEKPEELATDMIDFFGSYRK